MSADNWDPAANDRWQTTAVPHCHQQGLLCTEQLERQQALAPLPWTQSAIQKLKTRLEPCSLKHSQIPRELWPLVWETQIDHTFPFYRQMTCPSSNTVGLRPQGAVVSVVRTPFWCLIWQQMTVKSRASAWCMYTDEWVGLHQKPRNSSSLSEPARTICLVHL